jgi:uncharacterized membrane protein YfcA
MSPTLAFLILVVGFAIGTASGMVGIGGGVLIIPVLMIGFGFSQARANGTSLAMLLPPIGIFAVAAYARAGNVDWRFATLLAIGFAGGAAVGGVAVNRGWINPVVLRVVFATLLLYVAGRTLFRPGGQARAAVETVALVTISTLAWAAMKRLGHRWEHTTGHWATVYASRRKTDVEFDYEI